MKYPKYLVLHKFTAMHDLLGRLNFRYFNLLISFIEILIQLFTKLGIVCVFIQILDVNVIMMSTKLRAEEQKFGIMFLSISILDMMSF